MKYVKVFLAIAVLTLSPLTAYAGCPSIIGPTLCCGRSWYQYQFDTSCAGTSGSVSNATLWCYSTPAKQFGTGSSSVTYSYTIGANDPILATWDADIRYVEWYDPNNSIYNTLTATVSVQHNGVTTSSTFLNINGTTSKSCSLEGGTFSAVAGDTVTVTINATIFNSNVTAQVGQVSLFTTS
ncbi:MAG: hypothetical protein M3Q69_13985 [Acidobacteriota bacterium]|nr:hypothetical protein [Acidobacteriota bacterium]